MSNITISIDEQLLKKAKKIAIDKDTSFSGLIRAYIEDLVNREEKLRDLLIEELDMLFETSTAETGPKRWTRDDLHER
jgi:metal-responsive CopG/Arc/MetJ family transcriptional regulator